MRQPAERFPFSPIAARPRLDLPHGKRIAVYLIVNVEVWDFDKPVPRQYFGAPERGATLVAGCPELVLARIRDAGRVLASARQFERARN